MSMKELLVTVMEQGASNINIQKASEYSEFTTEYLSQLNSEKGLAFSYDSTTDTLTMTRE